MMLEMTGHQSKFCTIFSTFRTFLSNFPSSLSGFGNFLTELCNFRSAGVCLMLIFMVAMVAMVAAPGSAQTSVSQTSAQLKVCNITSANITHFSVAPGVINAGENATFNITIRNAAYPVGCVVSYVEVRMNVTDPQGNVTSIVEYNSTPFLPGDAINLTSGQYNCTVGGIYKVDTMAFYQNLTITGKSVNYFSVEPAVNVTLAISPLSSFLVQPVDFFFTIKNAGNANLSDVWVSMKIYDPTDVIVHSFISSFVGSVIQPGQSVAPSDEWYNNNCTYGVCVLGTYAAKVVAYSGVAPIFSFTKSFNITNLPPPPPPVTTSAPSAGPISTIPPNVTVPSGAPAGMAVISEFTKMPILYETYPGESIVMGFVVLSKEKLSDLKTAVTGIPDSWVTIVPEAFDLEAGRSQAIRVLIDVPVGSSAGDYGVKISVMNASAVSQSSTFFIMRVKSYLPVAGKPFANAVAFRSVDVDSERKTTRVTIRVRNGENFTQSIKLTETISKDLATSINDVTFSQEPSRVVEPDPVVEWELEQMSPGEVRAVSYAVGRVLRDYSKYVYWPLEQMVTFYEKLVEADRLGILGIRIPTLFIGDQNKVSIALRNLYNDALNVSIRLDAPENWKLEPQEMNRVLKGNATETLEITMTPDKQTKPGTYRGTIQFAYPGRTIEREVLFIAETKSLVNLTTLLYLFIILNTVHILYRIIKMRKEYYEKDRVVLRQVKKAIDTGEGFYKTPGSGYYPQTKK